MKALKQETVITTFILIFLAVMALCSYGIVVNGSVHASGGSKGSQQVFDNFSGRSEFYYRPVDDNRIWHVINNYSEFGSDYGRPYNMSYYTFDSDSVLVINEYSCASNQDLANYFLKTNNLNNQ